VKVIVEMERGVETGSMQNEWRWHSDDIAARVDKRQSHPSLYSCFCQLLPVPSWWVLHMIKLH